MDPGLLRRPWRLLVTRWPWLCLAYLLAHLLGGLITWITISTVILFPLWARGWARVERRLVQCAGREALQEPAPHGGGVSWREIALALVTASLTPIGMLGAGALAVWVASTLLSPVSGAQRFTLAQVAASIGQPVAVALGLLSAPLVLWGLCAAAVANAWLSARLLSPRVEELEAQVQALAAAAVRTQDELLLERRLLQQQLHDGAQLQISVAGVRLGVLEYDLESAVGDQDRPQVLATLAQVRESLDGAVDAIRDAAQGLSPPLLRERGLGPALRALVRDLPLPVTVRAELPRAGEALEADLYFIAAEAVTNTVKHARATRATIDLRADERQVTLTITDDGAGGAKPTGAGLLGIGTRAARWGGSVALHSPTGAAPPDTGTQITVRIPWKEAP